MGWKTARLKNKKNRGSRRETKEETKRAWKRRPAYQLERIFQKSQNPKFSRE